MSDVWPIQINNVFPVHAINAYKGIREITPLILNRGTTRRWKVNFRPRPLYPRELEAEWAPEPVWMFWKTEKSLALTAIRTPDGPARIMKSIQFQINLTHTFSFLFYFFRFCIYEIDSLPVGSR